MNVLISRFAFPLAITIIGVIALAIGFNTEQNSLFLFASVGIVVIGIISALSAADIFSKKVTTIIFFVFIALSGTYAYYDFWSIKTPIDFLNEKERRYKHVIQKLKDIRIAEMAYKAEYGKYTGDFDTLLNFIKTDSFTVVKAVGFVPDTLTEARALELGLISRDTFRVAVGDSIFNTTYLGERAENVPFKIDSIPFIPFTGGQKFKLQAGIIEKNKVKISVFEALDVAAFDKNDAKKVGSMTDPSTAGNWGE